jgi:putative endonuclease
MRRTFFVYIMSSRNGVLYTGVTNDLERRTSEHKRGEIAGFSKRYRVNRLVHLEEFDDVVEAIAREKQIKGWVRRKKVELVKSMNPGWKDLAARSRARDPSLRSG